MASAGEGGALSFALRAISHTTWWATLPKPSAGAMGGEAAHVAQVVLARALAIDEELSVSAIDELELPRFTGRR